MKSVQHRLEELGSSGRKHFSAKFSIKDLQKLIASIVCDKEYRIRSFDGYNENNEPIYNETSVNTAYRKFLNSVYIHAGIYNQVERARLIDTFEPSVNDLKWIELVADEAERLYLDLGKNLRLFRRSKVWTVLRYKNGIITKTTRRK